MKVVDDLPNYRVMVEFQDEHRYRQPALYISFKKGTVKNPYDRSVVGVGYLGPGKFPAKTNGKLTEPYVVWRNILLRCYSDAQKKRYPAYYGVCFVCDEWLNFQNFAAWYTSNRYDCKGRLHIDKDILCPGNKEYGPDKCILVPQWVNMMFMNKTNHTGLPNGVRAVEGGYVATFNCKEYGTHKTVEEAYEAYAAAKQKHVHEMVQARKDELPDHVFHAIMSYRFDMQNDKNYKQTSI